MGWATFIIVPLSIVIAWVEPISVTALGPASALAFWNWRRLLRREPRELAPTTTAPDGAKHGCGGNGE